MTMTYDPADRYAPDTGRVLLSGIQALVRLPLDQHRADTARGLSTATFITGYEGSPIGGYDLQLLRLGRLLADHGRDGAETERFAEEVACALRIETAERLLVSELHRLKRLLRSLSPSHRKIIERWFQELALGMARFVGLGEEGGGAGRSCLVMVPVAVGLEHSSHAQRLAQFEQQFVFVGSVEQNCVTCLGATDHEHVVLERSDHHLVNLDAGPGPMQCHGPSLARARGFRVMPHRNQGRVRRGFDGNRTSEIGRAHV